MVAKESYARFSYNHPKGPGRPENSFFWPTREDNVKSSKKKFHTIFQLQNHHTKVIDSTYQNMLRKNYKGNICMQCFIQIFRPGGQSRVLRMRGARR